MNFLDNLAGRSKKFEKVRFKKTVLVGYFIAFIILIALIVRMVTGLANEIDSFDYVTFLIAMLVVVAVQFVCSFAIWQFNKDKGWTFMDVLIPAAMFTACAIFIVFHIVLTP